MSDHAQVAVGAPTPLEQPPDLLTAREVADRLRIGKSTVYVLARSEGLPFITIGRLWRCPANMLEEWIANKMRTTD